MKCHIQFSTRKIRKNISSADIFAQHTKCYGKGMHFQGRQLCKNHSKKIRFHGHFMQTLSRNSLHEVSNLIFLGTIIIKNILPICH